MRQIYYEKKHEPYDVAKGSKVIVSIACTGAIRQELYNRSTYRRWRSFELTCGMMSIVGQVYPILISKTPYETYLEQGEKQSNTKNGSNNTALSSSCISSACVWRGRSS